MSSVSDYTLKVFNPAFFYVKWTSSCERIMEQKNTPFFAQVVCFSMLDFETSKSNSEVSKSNSNIFVRNYFFLKTEITSMEPFLTNMLYYQHSIIHYQVRFNATN